MKCERRRTCGVVLCHSPHGECGLKYITFDPFCRGARHSPHGECGLKSLYYRYINTDRDSHSPHGECGLK